MDFKESISNYILQNYSTKDLPKIAEKALMENMESESICILAGMSDKDNSLEILNYFQKSLKELNYILPDKLQSSKILIKYYLNQILKNPDEAYEIMMKIDNEVYQNFQSENSKKQYVGEEFHLQNLYTWYREIQDWKDNGRLLYFNDLNRDEQLLKFKEMLVNEAQTALNKFY